MKPIEKWTRWDAIKWFYEEHQKAILSLPANVWAMDPNAWNSVMELTPIEAWLWGDIREANAVFYPQWPVAGIFVDFANPVAKVAIECDGKAYHTDAAKDAARDAKLEALGWDVYRITGSQCRTDCDEDTGEPGYARRFVDEIADYYGLRRTAEKPSGLDHGFNGALQFLERIIEQNTEVH